METVRKSYRSYASPFLYAAICASITSPVVGIWVNIANSFAIALIAPIGSFYVEGGLFP